MSIKLSRKQKTEIEIISLVHAVSLKILPYWFACAPLFLISIWFHCEFFSWYTQPFFFRGIAPTEFARCSLAHKSWIDSVKMNSYFPSSNAIETKIHSHNPYYTASSICIVLFRTKFIFRTHFHFLIYHFWIIFPLLLLFFWIKKILSLYIESLLLWNEIFVCLCVCVVPIIMFTRSKDVYYHLWFISSIALTKMFSFFSCLFSLRFVLKWRMAFHGNRFQNSD